MSPDEITADFQSRALVLTVLLVVLGAAAWAADITAFLP